MKNTRPFLIASIVAFATALFLPVDNVKGWQLLVFGLMGISKGGAICLLWLANPILVFSWLTYKNTAVSFRLSLLAVLLSISFYAIEEAFHPIGIKKYGLGYWVWTASSMIMFVGNVILKNKPSRIDR